MKTIMRFIVWWGLGIVAFAQPPVPHNITLTWTAWTQGTGDAATGLRVKRSTVSGGPYSAIKDLPITATSFSDDNNGAGLPVALPLFYVVVPTIVVSGVTIEGSTLSAEATCDSGGAPPKCAIPFVASPVTGLKGSPK